MVTDELRTFVLFGRTYWWMRLPDGRLSLQRVTWTEVTDRKASE
jgi:hypothetical protein